MYPRLSLSSYNYSPDALTLISRVIKSSCSVSSAIRKVYLKIFGVDICVKQVQVIAVIKSL